MSPKTTDMFRCSEYNTVLSSFTTYQGVCNKSNTTGATSGAGTACPSGAPEFNPDFSGVRVARSLTFCIAFCRSLFVLFSILSVCNLAFISKPIHEYIKLLCAKLDIC